MSANAACVRSSGWWAASVLMTATGRPLILQVKAATLGPRLPAMTGLAELVSGIVQPPYVDIPELWAPVSGAYAE